MKNTTLLSKYYPNRGCRKINTTCQINFDNEMNSTCTETKVFNFHKISKNQHVLILISVAPSNGKHPCNLQISSFSILFSLQLSIHYTTYKGPLRMTTWQTLIIEMTKTRTNLLKIDQIFISQVKFIWLLRYFLLDLSRKQQRNDNFYPVVYSKTELIIRVYFQKFSIITQTIILVQ